MLSGSSRGENKKIVTEEYGLRADFAVTVAIAAGLFLKKITITIFKMKG